MTTITDEKYFTYKFKNKANGPDILPLAVEYLSQTYKKTEIAELFADKIAINAYLFIAKLIAYESNCFDYTPFEEHNFEIFVSKLMTHFCGLRSELDFEQQKAEMSMHLLVDQILENVEEIKNLVLKCSIFITNLVPAHSVRFARNFPKVGGLKGYLEFLNDDEFVANNLDTKLLMWDKKETMLVEYCILNVGSLSKHCEDQKRTWLRLNTVAILLKMSKLKPSFKYLSYTGITNVADDEQIEQLEEIQDYAEMQVDRLQKLHNSLISTHFKRDVRQIFENNLKYDCEMLTLVLPNNISTSIYNILQGLYKLSINNKMKDDIFFKLNAKEYLKTFLVKGNIYEIKWTVRVLAQLSFNPEVALYLDIDTDYMEFINKTIEHPPALDKSSFELDTFSICEKISWNISEAKEDRDKAATNEESGPPEKKDTGNEQLHIMISYNAGEEILVD
jgi:hypothetical protein